MLEQLETDNSKITGENAACHVAKELEKAVCGGKCNVSALSLVVTVYTISQNHKFGSLVICLLSISAIKLPVYENKGINQYDCSVFMFKFRTLRLHKQHKPCEHGRIPQGKSQLSFKRDSDK